MTAFTGLVVKSARIRTGATYPCGAGAQEARVNEPLPHVVPARMTGVIVDEKRLRPLGGFMHDKLKFASQMLAILTDQRLQPDSQNMPCRPGLFVACVFRCARPLLEPFPVEWKDRRSPISSLSSPAEAEGLSNLGCCGVLDLRICGDDAAVISYDREPHLASRQPLDAFIAPASFPGYI
jgi:hypothetical protein